VIYIHGLDTLFDNSSLLAEVEAVIKLDENKFRYVTRKQFIDIAVADYLRRRKR